MATINKIDITTQLFTTVPCKPPVPPASFGKFHNRGSGKLFRSTFQNSIFSDRNLANQSSSINTASTKEGLFNSSSPHSDKSSPCLELVVHPGFKTEDDITNTNDAPSYCRRTQSAKARERSKSKTDSKCKNKRPQSAGHKFKDTGVSEETISIIDLASKVIPDLFEIEKEKLLALPAPKEVHRDAFQDCLPMHFSNPLPEFYSVKTDNKQDLSSKLLQNDLKPCVYGLQRRRYMFGSAPDLRTVNDDCDTFPYKCSNDETNAKMNDHLRFQNKCTPTTLDPLLPWLQKDVPAEVLGVDPATCIVLLSPVDWGTLPEVPEMLGNEDDLAFVKDVTTPKPWNPKKYPHYYNKQPVEDWVCSHGHTPLPHGDLHSQTVYRPYFKMPRMRTADVVRKEITDLENLIKGVGNKDSSCGLVQYQSEIAQFQYTLNETLQCIPDRLKNIPKPIDTFGLNKLCADHDIFISEIQARVQECREELADLELEAGIATSRRHFTRPKSAM
ncbi:uncharacterized protein LOC127875130 [Dreissena polymorpha]|uniref:uncharacterized protein LOC127875130 n=1 Tax=Dreissena polymorpha TaxID=45954 RepID=UPI0022646EAD|nr:uncharacterized protein LOC127875130 [Dreissena polymorpha]